MVCTKEKINSYYRYSVFPVNNGNLKKILTKKTISIIIKSTLAQISLQSRLYKCDKFSDIGINSVITNFLVFSFVEDLSLNYKFNIKDIIIK